MVGTTSVELTQSGVNSVLDGTAAEAQLSQTFTHAIVNFPTEETNTSQIFVSLVADEDTRDVDLSEAHIRVVCRGRVFDPKIRVWTFTLDGHDFYVLRLGDGYTLVYDMLSEQWSVWSSGEFTYWSVYNGINWLGGNSFANFYGSNVIVGSDANGSLFFLDPDKVEDDPAADGRGIIKFRRQLTGQLVARGYDVQSLHEIQVLGSVNQLESAQDPVIDLQYSDDRGDTYVSAGTITTVDNDYDIRAHWQSLGSFASPGRLIRLEDYGALTRVDSFTVELGGSKEK